MERLFRLLLMSVSIIGRPKRN